VNIRISNEGHIYIQRGDRTQQQTCPYKNLPCGDWCPLFGEPEPETRATAEGWQPTGRMVLPLCKGGLVGEITDERVAK
jgi:hypothetical protein